MSIWFNIKNLMVNQKVVEKSNGKGVDPLRFIVPGDIVLEGGCGKISVVRRGCPEARIVIGLDLLMNSLKINKEIDYKIAGDLQKIPFKDAFFDVVYLYGVVEHLQDPKIAFKECHRVLRKGGRIILITRSIYNPLNSPNKILPLRLRKIIKERVFKLEDIDLDTFPAPYRANSSRKIYKLLTKIGFKKVRVWYWGVIPVKPQKNLLLFTCFLAYEWVTDLLKVEFIKVGLGVCYKKT